MVVPQGFTLASALPQKTNQITQLTDFMLGIEDQTGTPCLKIFQTMALEASAQVETITLAAASTPLGDTNVPVFVRLDPDGSNRTVVLPALVDGRQYVLINVDTAFTITVEDQASATVATLDSSSEAAWVVYDLPNTTWINIPLGGGGGGGGSTYPTVSQVAVTGAPLDMSTTADTDIVEFLPTADTVVTLTDKTRQTLWNKNSSFQVELRDSGGTFLGFIGGGSVHQRGIVDYIVDEAFIFLA